MKCYWNINWIKWIVNAKQNLVLWNFGGMTTADGIFTYLLTYLLTYSSALRPSQSLALLTYGRPFFPVFCLLLSSLNPHLPQILLHIFQPPQAMLSVSTNPFGLISNVFLFVLPWFILATCPTHSNLFFLISATMSTSIRMYRCIDVSPSIPQQFLLSISLLYHRSTYPSQYFPLPCTQSFHIHLSHSRRFTPKH